MNYEKDDIELSKLSHALWKQKILYTRACELSEKTIVENKYIPSYGRDKAS